MAESKEEDWIRTKKRTDHLIFGSQDDTREGHGHVNNRKREQDEQALASVFDTFDRKIKSRQRKLRAVVTHGSWTKYQAPNSDQ